MKFENQTVTNYFQHGKNIPKQYNMTLLKTIGGWDLYEWYP
jgi:hypothetical protein